MAIRPQWLQRYRQASFRGAIFHVSSVDSEYGRRIVTHQYPQRDTPNSEDMGRKARRFPVTGLLVGSDYDTARDRLIEACEKPGGGPLVHPYRGTLRVVCESLTVRERVEDGGYCEVSMTFIEHGANQFPAPIANPATAVDMASGSTQRTAAAMFEAIYDVSNSAEFVRTEMRLAANTLLGPADRRLSASSDSSDSTAALKRDLDTLIFQPRALAAGFLRVINDVTRLVGMNRTASATLHDMATRTLRLVPQTTGTRVRQARAQNAMQAMVQQMATAEHARVVLGQPYDSYQEALTSRAELIEEIDSVSETAADAVFDSLLTLRAKVVQSMPDPKLPEIQTMTMRQAVPALVLAYRLYGDALRDADITARNRIRHPGFIPGGSSVEVVLRG
jgi:prophage DNA circulation protein